MHQVFESILVVDSDIKWLTSLRNHERPPIGVIVAHSLEQAREALLESRGGLIAVAFNPSLNEELNVPFIREARRVRPLIQIYLLGDASSLGISARGRPTTRCWNR